MLRNLLTSFSLLLVTAFAHAQAVKMTVTEEGGVGHIVIDGDSTAMDWVMKTDGTQFENVGKEYQWGLGTVKVNGVKMAWKEPMVRKSQKVVYAIGDAVVLTVERQLKGDDVIERYTFRNISKKVLSLSEIDINTPFNDDNADGAVSMKSRCHAHVWASGTAGYVCALRKGAYAPHLGLMVIDGSLEGYSIKAKHQQAMRGVICLSPEGQILQPGKECSIAWRVFSHGGGDDFYSQMLKRGGVQVLADRYVAQVGEQVKVYLYSNNDDRMGMASYFVKEVGDIRVPMKWNGGTTYVEVLGIKSVEDMLTARARYVLDAFRKGAEGRMESALFLAEIWQKTKDERLKNDILSTLKMYMEKQMATPTHAAGEDGRWMPMLCLAMFKVTGDAVYIDKAYAMLKEGNEGEVDAALLAAVPVAESLELMIGNGREALADTLLEGYREIAERCMRDADRILEEEVVKGYGGVSAVVGFLSEMYVVTEDEQYLEQASRMMDVLEACALSQPSSHLNGMPLCYADEKVEGKTDKYGDIMPHYTCSMMANSLAYFSLCTGDDSYMAKARNILRATLGLFTGSGKGSTAFIYPNRVNGVMTRGVNAVSGGQDIALMYYLKWM